MDIADIAWNIFSIELWLLPPKQHSCTTQCTAHSAAKSAAPCTTTAHHDYKIIEFVDLHIPATCYGLIHRTTQLKKILIDHVHIKYHMMW